MCECLYRGFASDTQAILETNEFISALAVIRGRDIGLLYAFVFRVYDSRGEGEISRNQIENIAGVAYGTTISQYDIKSDLDKLFSNTTAQSRITFREFEVYRGSLRSLTEWIIAVLRYFVELPPTRLEALERKYSISREAEQMMIQYNIPKSYCNKLYRAFCAVCGNSSRPEMDLDTWLNVTAKFVHPYLALEIFRSKLHDVKVAWRFVDFFEFCFLFGLFLPNTTDADAESMHQSSITFSTVERQAAALCTIFQLAAERETERLLSLSQAVVVNADGEVVTPPPPSPRRNPRVATFLYMRRLVYLLSIQSSVGVTPPASRLTPEGVLDAREGWLPDSDMQDLSSLRDPSTGKAAVRNAVVKALLELEGSCKVEPTLKEYMGLLCGFQDMLPGFKQLSMIACCAFGVRPLVPELEKIFIIDMTLKRQEEMPQTRQFPNGPVGTEWCVVSASWLNSWRFFVGHKRPRGMSATTIESPTKVLSI